MKYMQCHVANNIYCSIIRRRNTSLPLYQYGRCMMNEDFDRTNGINSDLSAVPFTARLNAYYRFEEMQRERPLIIDPFAEKLAGDMSDYFEKHLKRSGDYGIVRSYYVENNLLSTWCKDNPRSQIVLLGAGLDTRAYRFQPFTNGEHLVFELDFPVVINYKEKILKNDSPICELIRIPIDLSHPDWDSSLLEGGFSEDVPTFWILEGFVYYLEKEYVWNMLLRLSELSPSESRLFADVCVPALAEVRFGPYMMHFKWGITIYETPSFIESTGWTPEISYADDHDQGRDVGQRGLIFIDGRRSNA
jgi:methyltransferase (TIGR00027 family)